MAIDDAATRWWRELLPVLDPDGDIKFLTQEEVDNIIAEEDGSYCAPDEGFEDEYKPHYHKFTRWEE